jgi:hypothetical protein
MLKVDYLAKTDVGNFVDWLAKQLNNKSLTHEYLMPAKVPVHFDGLEDALRKYDWPFSFINPVLRTFVSGHTYRHNDDALKLLLAGLSSSFRAATPSLQDQQIRDWAIAVMEWGGVRNGNVTWLQTNVTGLAAEIDAACKTLAKGNDDRVFLGGPIRRFNAGMSKIYALLVPEFIIYDSRVAAALAWLITRWCIETERTSVPDLLRFPCMRPKEGDNPAIRKVRNPSCGAFRFPWLYGALNHAHWNLRASWILSAALDASKQDREKNQFLAQPNPLRALEAALFMWGYDLSRNSPCGAQVGLPLDEPDEDVAETVPEGSSEETRVTPHKSTTRGGKAKEFKWAFEPNGDRIRIDRDPPEPDYFETKEVFALIHILYDHFGSDWYPLANSVTKLQDKTEKIGLGSVLHSLSMNVTHAQAASQLGVVLEEVGIFEWNEKPINIAWRLRVEPPGTIDDLRTALCGAGPDL